MEFYHNRYDNATEQKSGGATQKTYGVERRARRIKRRASYMKFRKPAQRLLDSISALYEIEF